MDSAPVQQKKLAIKISLKDDIRRISVDPKGFNFEALKAAVRRLFKTLTDEDANSLVVRYQDDESDFITISSDEELAEAISLLKAGDVLRFTLSESAAFQQQRCQQRWRGRCGRWRQQQEGGEQRGEQRERCGGGWKRGWGRRARFFQLQQEALRLMETGTTSNIEAARALLNEQLQIFEHSTPIYNIACCEALLGNSKEALEWLQKAVTAGYTDVNHIENDADLVSVRNLDGFKTIIATLKRSAPVDVSRPAPAPVQPAKPVEIKTAIPVQFAHVVPVEAKPVAVKPVVPSAPPAEQVPAPQPKNDPLAVLSRMGFTHVQSNVTALAQARGDISEAVHLLLNENHFTW